MNCSVAVDCALRVDDTIFVLDANAPTVDSWAELFEVLCFLVQIAAAASFFEDCEYWNDTAIESSIEEVESLVQHTAVNEAAAVVVGSEMSAAADGDIEQTAVVVAAAESAVAAVVDAPDWEMDSLNHRLASA